MNRLKLLPEKRFGRFRPAADRLSLLRLVPMLVLILALATAGPGVAQDTAPRRPDAEESVLVPIDIQGRKRQYRLFVPDGAAGQPRRPLVLVFHGAGGTAEEMERLTQFNRVARREGFLVAYPQGLYRNWNDGRGALSSLAHLDNVNDLAFIDALVKDISGQHPLEERRIYAAGLSNGGGFSHYLAAMRPDLIAAIATVGGSIAQPLSDHFAPEKPVSVLLIHGSDDPITPVDGGGVLRGFRGRVLGAQETAQMWARANSCKETPEGGTLDDEVQDGCRTRWYRWRNQGNGVDVTLFLIDGMGHTWPGRPPYMAERIIGRSCYDFDASTLIWRFFAEHPRPAQKPAQQAGAARLREPR